MVTIQKLEETLTGQFGLDLKELMIKHDIRKITPAFNDMEISVSEGGDGFLMTGVSLETGIAPKNNVLPFKK